MTYGHNIINRLLVRLDSVRETKPGQWSARCPAHEDRSPSLSVKEASDGKILINCHSGCSVESIVSAVGLELRDLFPDSTMTRMEKRQYRQQMNRRSIEKELLHELWILMQTVSARVNERTYPRDYWIREKTAVKRIRKAFEVLYG